MMLQFKLGTEPNGVILVKHVCIVTSHPRWVDRITRLFREPFLDCQARGALGSHAALGERQRLSGSWSPHADERPGSETESRAWPWSGDRWARVWRPQQRQQQQQQQQQQHHSICWSAVVMQAASRLHRAHAHTRQVARCQLKGFCTAADHQHSDAASGPLMSSTWGFSNCGSRTLSGS